jgi:hypothetical protein
VPKLFIRPVAAGFAIISFAYAGIAPALPKTDLDGAWSVLVITDSGDCDRAYRYPVRIEAGAVTYRGDADVNVSGRVDGSGKVNVSVNRGSQSAHGNGRLAEGRHVRAGVLLLDQGHQCRVGGFDREADADAECRVPGPAVLPPRNAAADGRPNAGRADRYPVNAIARGNDAAGGFCGPTMWRRRPVTASAAPEP